MRPPPSQNVCARLTERSRASPTPTTPTCAARMVPFIVKPVFTTWPTVPASFSSSGYSKSASCSPGSKASPTAPNSSTPCAPKALTSWPRVNSTPSIKDSSDASSPFAASKAYPRLSETSNRLFAKPCDAKSFAAWTSRSHSSGIFLLGDGAQQLVF